MSARRRLAPAPAGGAARAASPAGAVWGQRLLLAGGLLAFCPGLLQPYFTPKSLACAAGLALAWLSWPRARRAALTAPVLALLAVAAVSCALAPDPRQSFWGDSLQPYYGLLELLLYALVYALSASADEALLEDGLAALAAAAAVFGAVAVLQQLGLVAEPWATMGGRVLGPAGNPVFFGALAALVLPSALRRGRFWAAAAVVALALSRARGAWLGGTAGAAAWLAASGRLEGRRKTAASALAAAAVCGALILAPSKRASDRLRLETWRAAVESVRQRPLLGFGPDGFMIAYRRNQSEEAARLSHSVGQGQTSAHDDLLQAAATLGLPGLAVYVWLLVAALLSVRRGLERGSRGTAAAAGAGLLGLFVAAKFNPVPVEGCVAAAWLAGAAEPRGEPSAPWAKTALSAAAVLLLGVFAAFAGAESARLSARQALQEGRFDLALRRARLARTLAPGRLSFDEGLGETIVTATRYRPAQAAALLDEGLKMARELAAGHPGNPSAFEIAGTMTSRDAQATNDGALYAEARGYFERAAELAPHHTFPVRGLLDIARATGDKDAEARATARLQRLAEINGERP